MKKATFATTVSTGLGLWRLGLAAPAPATSPSATAAEGNNGSGQGTVARPPGGPSPSTRRTRPPAERTLCAVWHLGTHTAQNRSGVPSDRPVDRYVFLARRDTLQRVLPAKSEPAPFRV